MNALEFLEQQVHALFLDFTERIANGEFGEWSEDDMCGLPMVIFSLEKDLLKALRLFFAEGKSK